MLYHFLFCSLETVVAGGGSDNERAKKVKKLNESFLKWASKQIETHPLSIWKEGVKVQLHVVFVCFLAYLTSLRLHMQTFYRIISSIIRVLKRNTARIARPALSAARVVPLPRVHPLLLLLLPSPR